MNAAPSPQDEIPFRLRQILLFIAGYLALAIAGQWLALKPGHDASIFLASGLYFAVLLSSAKRDWLRWAATAYGVEAVVQIGLYHEGAAAGLIDALGHTLGMLAAAHVVRVWRGLPYQLNTLPDVMAFACATALVSPLAGIALDLVFSSVSGREITGAQWLIYWTGNAAGVLVVTPLILTLRKHLPACRGLPAARWLEGAVLALMLVVMLHFIFSNRLPAVFLTLPLILWAAARFGMPGITLVMAIFAVIIISYSSRGLGPYGVSPARSALLAQSFLALATISALCLGAIIDQYQAAQRALRHARDELEQRVAQRTAALAESEQRLRALLDGIPDRAWLKDAQGRYIAVNRASGEGYAMPAAQIIGKTIFDIRPRDVAERIAAEDRTVMTSGAPMRFERRSNTYGNWIEITKTPIFGVDGTIAGIVGVWRDITARKQAEQQALRDSEQRYRTLVNATSQAIWILNAEGSLSTIIKSITGDDLAHVQNRNWLDFIHTEDRAGAAEAMQAAIASKSAYEHEHRIVNREGGWRDVLARAAPVLNADGSVREWIGTSMDVSGRKQAERALRESNQTLRRLSGRREEMLEAERARIAHNLHDGAGQSLNVVRIKLAALAQGAAHGTPAGGQAAQLAEIQNILDQVNLEIRSLEFELSPPVLRQLGLVPALGWLGEEMQRSYGLHVSVSDDGEDKPLDLAHRASTFRAVRELLINVAKHAKVNTAHVDAQRVDRTVLVTVSDMGVGFDAAQVELIESSGLGLTGVRERIEFAGGSVRFNSAPGSGTAVTIIMPLNEEM